MPFTICAILCLIGIVCSILAVFFSLKMKKACKEANDMLVDLNKLHQTLRLKHDTLKREKEVLEKENKQLKTELEAERKVIAAHNCKSVEELPKTEKVAKPRGRKPKATK